MRLSKPILTLSYHDARNWGGRLIGGREGGVPMVPIPLCYLNLLDLPENEHEDELEQNKMWLMLVLPLGPPIGPYALMLCHLEPNSI